jgi:hypothetical protein
MNSRRNLIKREYVSRQRGKRDLSLVAKLIVGVGMLICLTSLLIAYTICVDRVSELLNSSGYQNNWHPANGGFIDTLINLPQNLMICFTKFIEAAFACVLFFPILILLVPIYNLYFYLDFTILLYGYVPFLVGFGVILSAIIACDSKIK